MNDIFHSQKTESVLKKLNTSPHITLQKSLTPLNKEDFIELQNQNKRQKISHINKYTSAQFLKHVLQFYIK